MLKEYIGKDLEVFINSDEFAENVVVNGQTVKVMIDNDRLSQKIVKEYDGMVIGDILFFISKEEYEKIHHVSGKPKPNEAIVFDGKPCVIVSVTHNLGLMEFVLQYAGGGR